jgi:hypothetical protein
MSAVCLVTYNKVLFYALKKWVKIRNEYIKNIPIRKKQTSIIANKPADGH